MIVVFKAPDGLNSKYVKRIIGLPGEKVKIINKMVYINGIPIDEDYLHFEDENCIEDSYRDNFPEVAIPEYHYFCLGDNRDKSFDSRLWGLVHADYFIGIPWRIYWSRDLSVAADPFVSFFSTIRWERIFKKAE
jgi:signal peptidase I